MIRIIRHLLVFSLLLLAAVILRRSIPIEPNTNTQEVQQQVQGESTQKDNFIDISYEDSKIRVRWFKVDDPAAIGFLPNYEDFVSSADVIEQHSCSKLVNGGFYNTDNTPLGLVVAAGVQHYAYRENSLMNGVLSINDFGTPRITRVIPSGNIINAVQTGPVLRENGAPIKLNLKSDKNARRSVAGVSGNNELYFFVLYDSESAYKGPLLEDLPTLISEVSSKLNLNIADAVNLDGGTASVFINGDVSLSELSPVGSFWCVI